MSTHTSFLSTSRIQAGHVQRIQDHRAPKRIKEGQMIGKNLRANQGDGTDEDDWKKIGEKG